MFVKYIPTDRREEFNGQKLAIINILCINEDNEKAKV